MLAHHQRTIDRLVEAIRSDPVFLALIMVEWVFNVPVFSAILYPLFRPYLTFWQVVIFGRKVLML